MRESRCVTVVWRFPVRSLQVLHLLMTNLAATLISGRHNFRRPGAQVTVTSTCNGQVAGSSPVGGPWAAVAQLAEQLVTVTDLDLGPSEVFSPQHFVGVEKMSKFNTTAVRTAVSSPVVSERVPSGVTHEGGPGFARDAKGELFLLSVTNMVGEQAFYEGASARDNRFGALVRQLAVADPEWTAGLLGWLRGDANMRSAAIVGAAEFAKARLDAGEHGHSRQVIDAVCQRADEPGEMLAYWTSAYGKALPKSVKRGLADAVVRLYTEYAAAKYNTASRAISFGRVVELSHPDKVSRPWQGDLFHYLVELTHGRGEDIPESLTMLRARAELMSLPVGERRAALADAERLYDAGITWEVLAGWLQGPMDAEAWEAVIPRMGYMALLRNLRNFDEAGVSDEVAATVAAKLADPARVAWSRQLPMRFLSAHRSVSNYRWYPALERALELSLANVPTLSGRTLVLVDTSSSMDAGFSRDGTLMRWDAAVVFGLALARRCAQADVVSFSNSWGKNPASKVFDLRKGESLLHAVSRWKDGGFFIDGGTDTAGAITRHLTARHDRLVILTDEQASGDVDAAIPRGLRTYTWNLAGYRMGHAASGLGEQHTFGGLSDAAFGLVSLIEAGQSARWPWES